MSTPPAHAPFSPGPTVVLHVDLSVLGGGHLRRFQRLPQLLVALQSARFPHTCRRQNGDAGGPSASPAWLPLGPHSVALPSRRPPLSGLRRPPRTERPDLRPTRGQGGAGAHPPASAPPLLTLALQQKVAGVAAEGAAHVAAAVGQRAGQTAAVERAKSLGAVGTGRQPVQRWPRLPAWALKDVPRYLYRCLRVGPSSVLRKYLQTHARALNLPGPPVPSRLVSSLTSAGCPRRRPGPA